MNNEKLSREQVPQKFAEWLLGMGYLPEKVPSEDKISEICRGDYYMVWRSLIEHVGPKDIVRQKRLQVFCDDVQKWQKKSTLERDTNMPEPIALWQQQTSLRAQVADMEARVAGTHDKLKLLMDKISIKLPQRNATRDRIEALQRRSWLLQRVAADLRAKKKDLEETRSIADSLCRFDENGDVQNKLEKCMSIYRKQVSPAACSSMLGSSSASANRDPDAEEQLSSLVSCRGDSLWPLLIEKRASLVAALTNNRSTNTKDTGPTPQSILAHTAALHATLALETMKNKTHSRLARKRVAAAVNDLSNHLSGEASELLVLRCERASIAARVQTLKALLDDVTARAGVFELSGDCGDKGRGTNIAQVDRDIVNKRDELKRLLTNLAATENKIQNVRECLLHIFNGFQKDMPVQETEKFRGLVEFPQESIVSVRQYFEGRRERIGNILQLSLEGCSTTEPTDINSNPTFMDELKIYLNKFCLEKNRKLFLESGEMVWISETLPALHSRLLSSLITPSACLSVRACDVITYLVTLAARKRAMEAWLEKIETGRKITFDIDLESKKAEENQNTDKIKKKIHENLLSLQKIAKTLDLGKENLNLWSENEMKKYISPIRKHDGKTYKDYEAIYIEELRFNAFNKS